MMTKHLSKLLPSKAERSLRRHRADVDSIRAPEREWLDRPQNELQEQISRWRDQISRLPGPEVAGALRRIRFSLMGIVCAAAAQLCQRAEATPADSHDGFRWGMRPYDVQLIGGLALQDRAVAEIETGEGKTLVATMPACLYALAGRGVHIVTANDYLARRDAGWMGQLFNYLGLTVDAIHSGQEFPERRAAYRADITYGTASEFGFDYLRDHSIVSSPEERIQRRPFYALVDEADSILIDEARVPLIISAPSGRSEAALYGQSTAKVAKLVREQQRYCNKLVGEARALIESASPGKLPWEAGVKLHLVQHGQPLNRCAPSQARRFLSGERPDVSKPSQ